MSNISNINILKYFINCLRKKLFTKAYIVGIVLRLTIRETSVDSCAVRNACLRSVQGCAFDVLRDSTLNLYFFHSMCDKRGECSSAKKKEARNEADSSSTAICDYFLIK